MTKRTILFFIVIILWFHKIFGISLQILNNHIDSLTADANAVVLEEDTKFTINSENSAEKYYNIRVLVKNASAGNFSQFSETQTEFWEIKDIKAVIKDTLGNILKELNDSDIKTALLSPGYSYYSDRTYTFFDLNYNIYPYVLEYSYKEDYKSLFFWPDWEPQYSVPCLSSTYQLVLKYPVKFNYKSIGKVGTPTKKIINGFTEYKWQVKNLPARIKEDFIPPEDNTQNAVLFSPDNFSLRNYKGSSKDWKSFGNWYKNLIKDRYTLTGSALKVIHQLLDTVETKEEKIKLLYKYLQENDHYVSIDLGISGWQPQSAQDVFNNRYGDCKDLSTYMISLLKVAGIKSYPALVLTRDKGKVIKDFPSSQFNHVIVFVPLENDSLWIECTGKFMDLGDTPSNIQGISALIVKENGGELVTTPLKKSTENLWVSKSKASLSVTGKLGFNISLGLYGDQKNHFKTQLSYNNEEDDKIFLKNIFGSSYNDIAIDKYNVKNTHSTKKGYNISLIGRYTNVTHGAGKLALLNPNLFNRESQSLLPKENTDERKFPVYYNYPFTDIDSVEIKLPPGYNLLAKPDNYNLEKPFGDFTAEYDFKDGKIYYYRKFEIKEREIPLKDYKDYRDFIHQVIKVDQAQFVFKRF